MIKVAIIAWILVFVMYWVVKFYFISNPDEALMIKLLDKITARAAFVVLLYLGSWIFAILSTIIAVIKFGG